MPRLVELYFYQLATFYLFWFLSINFYFFIYRWPPWPHEQTAAVRLFPRVGQNNGWRAASLRRGEGLMDRSVVDLNFFFAYFRFHNHLFCLIRVSYLFVLPISGFIIIYFAYFTFHIYMFCLFHIYIRCVILIHGMPFRFTEILSDIPNCDAKIENVLYEIYS